MTKYLPNKSSQRKLALFRRRKKHQGSSIYYIHIYRHNIHIYIVAPAFINIKIYKYYHKALMPILIEINLNICIRFF